jgi:hypothetical protein
MNSSRKSTSGAKSVGVDVVVENPRPVFEVAEEAFNGATQRSGARGCGTPLESRLHATMHPYP